MPSGGRVLPSSGNLARYHSRRLIAALSLADTGASPLMNIVLDTNVIVAAGFAKDSDAAAIVEAVRNDRFTLIWDKATERETRRIVEQIPPLAWGDFTGLYREANRYTGDLSTDRFTAVEGPLDRHFAALAEATDSVLVTNDDDLLGVREQFELTIDTPGEFARKHM